MKLYIENNQSIPAVKLLDDSATPPTGYTDKSTDLVSWDCHAIIKCSDYLQLRAFIQHELNEKAWENLSTDERDVMIKYHLDDENEDAGVNAVNKVTHLMTTGQALSQEAARTILVDSWSSHHLKEKEASVKRLKSKKVYSVIGNYLSTDDGADFFRSISLLFTSFSEQAIKGTQDGVSIEGLFDYIESTPGSVYEQAGLASKGFVMQNGDEDETNFIIDLMDVLRHGNY